MSSYKFSTSIEVRFRDLDALGHVNNAVYLTYFEIARLHYWKKLLGEFAFEEHSFVVVRAECNYRSPAEVGQVLKVFAKVSEMRNSSFVFSYEIIESQSGRLVSEGSTVQACFDPKKKKAKPIPQDLRKRILDFERAED
jgi:acyl-CoA thioester hydrolase